MSKQVLLPPPTVEPTDSPTIQLCLNTVWAGYVIGMIRQAQYPEYWSGTLDENRAARQGVKTIMEMLMNIGECSDMNPCCDGSDLLVTVISRINIDGSIEISIDNGGTWHPDPNDPRVTAPSQPPPVDSGISANKCDAATNVLEKLQDLVVRFGDIIEGFSTVQQFLLDCIAAILEAIFILLSAPQAAAMLPIAVSFITSLIGHEKDAYLALFTTEVWDAVTCILYCHINSHGVYTDAGFSGVLADCDSKIPGGIGVFTAAASIKSFIRVWGVEGINIAAATGNAAEADCADCDCGCDSIKFTVITGTLVSSGTDDDGNCFIEMSSEPHGGGAHETVTVVFNDTGTPDANCAAFFNSEITAGTPDILSQFSLDCPGTGSYHTIVGNPCMSAYDAESDSGFPYTLKLFVNCGTDCGCLE